MTQYINKDALVAEIERIQKRLNIDDIGGRSVMAWSEGFKNFIDTLEVKEVDLEKELNTWRHNHFHGRRDKDAAGEYLERSSQLDIAKHFFELGLKAKEEKIITDKEKLETMKELSIEEKAKRYDEALKIAKEINNEQRAQPFNVMTRVFPELKESEDERTWIINYLSNRKLNSSIIAEKENLKKAIAWLEKQGQVKESVISQHENKTCKEKDDSLTNENERIIGRIKKAVESYWSDEPLDEILAWLERQGEQKPVEPQQDMLSREQYAKAVDECIYGEKSEWSEEELDSITAAINNLEYLKKNYVYHPMGLEPAITFLKSLKDRVLPQPKQEWSEQEQVRINRIVALLENMNVADNDILLKDVDWLKSLRLRNTWKPSESDIIILEQVIDGTVNPINYQATLHAILEQLKKLREE